MLFAKVLLNMLRFKEENPSKREEVHVCMSVFMQECVF